MPIIVSIIIFKSLFPLCSISRGSNYGEHGAASGGTLVECMHATLHQTFKNLSLSLSLFCFPFHTLNVKFSFSLSSITHFRELYRIPN